MHWTETDRAAGAARIAASPTARPFAFQHLFTPGNVQTWAARLLAGALPPREAGHLLTCLTHDSLPKPVLRVDEWGRNATTRTEVADLTRACLAATRSEPAE